MSRNLIVTVNFQIGMVQIISEQASEFYILTIDTMWLFTCFRAFRKEKKSCSHGFAKVPIATIVFNWTSKIHSHHLFM